VHFVAIVRRAPASATKRTVEVHNVALTDVDVASATKCTHDAGLSAPLPSRS
jgi:hypothetical protein